MEQFLASELKMTEQTFGPGTASWMQTKASFVFAAYSPAEKVGQAAIGSSDIDLTKRLMGGSGMALVGTFNSYIEGLVLNFFVASLRFFIFGVWLLVLIPVFIAALVDGFVQRSIKRAEFGAIRPAAFAFTSMVVIPLAMAPLLYLVAPFSLTPLVAPLWTLLMILPLSAMVANSQPIFGRA